MNLLFTNSPAENQFKNSLIWIIGKTKEQTTLDLPHWMEVQIDHRADQMFLHLQGKNISELAKASVVFKSKTNLLLHSVHSFELRRNTNAFVRTANNKINIWIKRKIPVAKCLIYDRANFPLPEKICSIIRPEKTEINWYASAKLKFQFFKIESVDL